jgi:hypothetical protein
VIIVIENLQAPLAAEFMRNHVKKKVSPRNLLNLDHVTDVVVLVIILQIVMLKHTGMGMI